MAISEKLVEKKVVKKVSWNGGSPFIFLPLGWFKLNELDKNSELLIEITRDEIKIRPYEEVELY